MLLVIKDVEILQGVEKIEVSAFWKCASLERVFIPQSVTEIKAAAFYGCSALERIEYGGTKTDWQKIVCDSPQEDMVVTGNDGTQWNAW